MLKNKIFFTTLALLIFVIIIIRSFVPYFEKECDCSMDWFKTITKITQLLVLIQIAKNGTTYLTVYFKIILIGLLVFTPGIMFTVMHWPGGKEMLIVGSAIIIVSYFLSFMRKESRTKLDVLKLLWVVATIIITCLTFQHLIARDSIILTDVLGWFIILFFVLEEYKKGQSAGSHRQNTKK